MPIRYISFSLNPSSIYNWTSNPFFWSLHLEVFCYSMSFMHVHLIVCFGDHSSGRKKQSFFTKPVIVFIFLFTIFELLYNFWVTLLQIIMDLQRWIFGRIHWAHLNGRKSMWVCPVFVYSMMLLNCNVDWCQSFVWTCVVKFCHCSRLYPTSVTMWKLLFI